MRTLQIELKRKNSRKIYKKRFLASGDQPEKGLKRCFILRFRQRHQDEKDKGGLEALSGGMGLGKEREKGEAEFFGIWLFGILGNAHAAWVFYAALPAESIFLFPVYGI